MEEATKTCIVAVATQQRRKGTGTDEKQKEAEKADQWAKVRDTGAREMTIQRRATKKSDRLIHEHSIDLTYPNSQCLTASIVAPYVNGHEGPAPVSRNPSRTHTGRR